MRKQTYCWMPPNVIGSCGFIGPASKAGPKKVEERGIPKRSIERSQRRRVHQVGGAVMQNVLCLMVLNAIEFWKNRAPTIGRR